MITISQIHNFIRLLIKTAIDLIRPSLGPSIPGLYSPCLYSLDCRTYAHLQFQEHTIIIATIKTTVRLLSCNPITGIFLYCYKKLNR